MILESLGHEAVLVAAFHFGASLGWHTGRGLLKVEVLLYSNNETIPKVILTFLKEALQHYDIGFLIITIALGVLFEVTNWDIVALIAMIGFGGGLAYSDKEDNPPEGILSHTVKKLRYG